MDERIAGLLGGGQTGLMGLLGSPALQVGMGLLAARHDGRINPFEAAMSGMANASQFRMLEQDRKREQEEQERLDKARELAQKIIRERSTVQMGPPTPDGQWNKEYQPSASDQLLSAVAGIDPIMAARLDPELGGGAYGTPAGVQEFEFLTEVAQEDSERGRAARVRLGLDPRATADQRDYAMRFFEKEGPDGRKRLFRVSPTDGSVDVLADDGSGFIPVGPQTLNPGQPGPTQSQPPQQPWSAPLLQPGQAGSTAPPSAVVGAGMSPRERAAAQEQGKADVNAGRITPERRALAQDKLQNVNLVRGALDDVRAAFSEIENSISAGPTITGQAIVPTAGGAKFDKAVAALAPFIRQLTRVPGEGSMSDYEQKLQQAALPDRTTFESVTKDQIDGWYRLLDQIESGYQGVLGGQSEGGAQEFDDMPDPTTMAGKMIEDDDGNRYRSDGKQWIKQ